LPFSVQLELEIFEIIFDQEPTKSSKTILPFSVQLESEIFEAAFDQELMKSLETIPCLSALNQNQRFSK